MNEKKKVWIVLGVVIAIIVFIIGVTIYNNMKSKKELKEFNNIFASSTETFIYLGRDGCSYCALFKPTLDKVMNDYNLSYKYINTSKLNEKDLHEITDKLEFEWDNYGTPSIAIVKDNTVIIGHIGSDVSEEGLVSFLVEGNMISKEE